MFKNYLKTALRSFKNNKSSFLINLTGLSIGMACSILIFLWVMDELNYNRFLVDNDQVYQMMEHQTYSGDIFTTTATPGILAENIKEDYPEILLATTYTWYIEFLLSTDETTFKERGMYAHPDIFSILEMELIYGSHDNLLNSPNSIAISQSTSEKYFGNENPVGQGLLVDNDELYTIDAVYKNLPVNSVLKFDVVIPFEKFKQNNGWVTTWGSNGPRTLIKVAEGTDIAQLNDKIADYIKQRNEGSVVELFAYPFGDLYLWSSFEEGKLTGGKIETVRIFTLVAIFILLIACINFMNLSTAKASKRAKEVGIRKSIGADKRSLRAQFIGESMIITFTAIFISVLLVELALPFFNDLTGKSIDINYLDMRLIALLLGTTLITGLIAGSYPAFYLSSFEAVKTLKGTIRSSAKEAFARKGLVIFQYTLSVILIISTIVIYQQVQYTLNANLGYDKDNLLYFTIEGDIDDNWEVFKREIENISGVTSASRAGATFMGRNSNTSNINWPGKDPNTTVLFENIPIDFKLIETMGFEIASGRSFSNEYSTDSSKIIINKKAAEIMDLENPVGSYINLWGNETEILGVVEDFHFQSLRSQMEPLIFRIAPQQAWRAYIRIQSDDIQNTMAAIENRYKEFNPGYPFEYSFMDQQYEAMYRSEIRIGKLSGFFAIFAIFISSLGLFGLSAFMAEQRAKEIGIRKVLGAEINNLILLLTKDFTILVLISIIIALPVSWAMMQAWLSDFAYSTSLKWWHFLAAGALAMVVAWITVSWQSVKASLANPVKSLKSN